MGPIPPFSKEAQALKLGLYEHFKGFKCEVIGIARHTETLEEMVVYRHLEGDTTLWTRPLKMFLEEVEIDCFA